MNLQGQLLATKRGPTGNLHSIFNCQVNYNDLPRQIIESVISTNNTNQQKPNNNYFDCYDEDSSDSSNNGKPVDDDVINECEDGDTPGEKSNGTLNSAHGENQLSTQSIKLLQPPDF